MRYIHKPLAVSGHLMCHKYQILSLHFPFAVTHQFIWEKTARYALLAEKFERLSAKHHQTTKNPSPRFFIVVFGLLRFLSSFVLVFFYSLLCVVLFLFCCGVRLVWRWWGEKMRKRWGRVVKNRADKKWSEEEKERKEHHNKNNKNTPNQGVVG